MKWQKVADGNLHSYTLVDSCGYGLAHVGRYKDNRHYQVSICGELAYLFSREETDRDYVNPEKCKAFVTEKIAEYLAELEREDENE